MAVRAYLPILKHPTLNYLYLSMAFDMRVKNGPEQGSHRHQSRPLAVIGGICQVDIATRCGLG